MGTSPSESNVKVKISLELVISFGIHYFDKKIHVDDSPEQIQQ
jgi:hypothetical protein